MTALLMFVSCIILILTFATTTVFDCPQMCICYNNYSEAINNQFGLQYNDSNVLTVDCRGGDVNESILAQELDLLLTDDELRENLLWLNISNTSLTKVPTSVCQLSNLQGLILDNNRLRRLPDNCFTNMRGLYGLTAENNSIIELQDGLFDGLNSLNVLNFRHNMIASIGFHVFSNPNDLVNLSCIALDNNLLESLEPWPYIRGLRGSSDHPVNINISNNVIYQFTNNIEWQFNCSRPSYAKVNMKFNIIHHLNDIMVGWNIASVTQFFCLMHPNEVFLPQAFNLGLYESWSLWYHCDCNDIYFYALDKHYEYNAIFEDITCDEPLSLHDRSVRDVPLIDFVCELSYRCPPSCRCVYRPANATLHVYCSAANLTSLPHDLPPLPSSHDKYKLDLSNNKLIQRLDHRPYLANTSVLDVSNCAIDSVDLNAWREFAMMPTILFEIASSTLENLGLLTSRVVMPVVLLHGNKIESLSVDITDINLTSVQLTLNDNPWKCSCHNRWMIGWFKSLSSGASSNVGDVLCASPSRLKGRSILDADEVDFCVDPSIRMLTIVLSSTLSAVAGLLLLGFAVHRLRVRLYKRWKFHPFDRDECVGEDMDYDVFLCCSSEDENPHGDCILELMESKGYRVCYHERDFRPGLILDNILQSILHSKHTVCFISSNFLRSAYCMTEFEMAYHQIVAVKRKKRLIVLMALDNPNELDDNNASDTTMLRQYIRQYTYIDYRRDDWLDKLLYALPLRGLLQRNDDQVMADIDNDDDVPLYQDI